MGYNGLGMQRWISTMKPRKLFEKRSKPDGGGGTNDAKSTVADYYHLNKNKLENLNSKTYPKEYKHQLSEKIENDKRIQKRFKALSLIIALFLIALIIWFLNKNFVLF